MLNPSALLFLVCLLLDYQSILMWIDNVGHCVTTALQTCKRKKYPILTYETVPLNIQERANAPASSRQKENDFDFQTELVSV